MSGKRPGAYASGPDACDMRGPSVGAAVFCELCRSWTNCHVRGCFTSPDGKYVPDDNSPEACAARLAAMKEEQ